MSLSDYADFLEEIGEANDVWNNQQRYAIAATEEKYGTCWLGNINLYDSNRDKPVMWQWNGDFVYNYGCSFVVPQYDAELERLILERDTAPYTGTMEDAIRVKKIIDRVFDIGGKCLIWS